MTAARCAAARWVSEASATSPCQAWAKVWATRRAEASDASTTVGVPSSGTLPALGLKLRTGQTTARGPGRASSGVAPERWTMTQVGETMAEMPSATSAMSPSVTATTTTWASAKAPAASVSLVVQGQPRASPRGRAEASVRLTTWRMSWPARFQTGANSRDTWPAPMSTMRSSATA